MLNGVTGIVMQALITIIIIFTAICINFLCMKFTLIFFDDDCNNKCYSYRQTGGSGNQCCYDSEGVLLTHPKGGGTIDKVSANVDKGEHFHSDVKPYLYCCYGLFQNCSIYYKHRPSDDGSRSHYIVANF